MSEETNLTHRTPMVIYCLLGLGFVAQGIRYLWATELMPYHMAVIQVSWGELAANHQRLFLGLLKGFGAGALSTGVAVILLALFPLRLRQPWAYLVTPLVSVTYIGALTYVTTFALLPGAVPIAVSKLFLALVLFASVASVFRARA